MKVNTLLIGLDGATFTVLDPLMKSGQMPFLKSFFENGVRADLKTIVPALTPPAWTSLMTGKRPGQHGVFDFFRLQSRDNLHLRFHTANDIQSETIWSLAASHGIRVTALNFPATFPPPRIPGYIIPGWIPWRQLRLGCWPEDLFDTLKRTVATFNPRELAMDISLEEKATEGCSDQNEYAPWIQLHTRREENWFDIFRQLTSRDPSELTAVLFDGVDKLQHLCWRFIKPEDDKPLTEAWELEARELCLSYFRNLDSILRRMCDRVGPDTTVVIASDHGFQPSREVFHLNAWLAERGYLAWSDAALKQSSDVLLGVGQVARHTWQLDWKRTQAFAATPTSNGIHILVNRDGNSPGIEPEQYETFRRQLTEGLLGFRHPSTNQPVIARVWTREEAFPGPYGDIAPDLTLELADGGLVSIMPAKHTISQRPNTSGVHAPVGVFGARGPGIRQGVDIGQLSILDVAPLVLHGLNLAVPSDIEGTVPQQLYETDAFQRRGPSRSKSAAATAPYGEATPQTTALSPDDEQAVLDRLRQLGYLE